MFRRSLQRRVAAAVASKPSVSYTPQQLGEAILAQGHHLLEQETDMQRVEWAHQLVTSALHEVDASLSLYTFGSAAVYGFHEPQSDVDFVALRPCDVVDGKAEDSQSQIAKSLQTDVLSKLGRVLQSRHIEWDVNEVKRARVPVVKIKTNRVDFDVTAHRRNGVRNSALLRAYYNQDPELRWVSLAIKSWSRRSGMNGGVGYLTSYAFNLMVIFFLLQQRVVQFVDPDICCASRIDAMPRGLPLEAPRDVSRISDLVLQFLHFYRYTFDEQTQVVSLSRPTPTTRAALLWTRTAEEVRVMNDEKVAYRFCIEDPYEVNLNVGRNVTAFKLDMMKRTFERGITSGLGLLSEGESR